MSVREFNAARLAFLDRLRDDGRMTPATRLVGWKIGSYLNSVTGDAWPSHEELVKGLKIGMRTVKRAIAELSRYGYYHIERRRTKLGRKNFYYPCFDVVSSKEVGAKLACTPKSGAGIKKDEGTAQFRPDVRAKGDLILPSKNSFRTPSTSRTSKVVGSLAASPLSGALARPPTGQGEAKEHAGQNGKPLALRDPMRGTYENEIARRLGPDGWNVLWNMYEQDWREYDRVCALQRDKKLSDYDIEQLRFRYGTTPTPADQGRCSTAEPDGPAVKAEYDGAVPRPRAEALARFDPNKPPRRVPPQRWLRFIDDCGQFLSGGWADKAAVFGWGQLDLFGCDRKRPFAHLDNMGLIWFINGGRIIELHCDHATIETRMGARHCYQRRRVEVGSVVLAWQLV
jgi:hypothetical protein